MLSVERVKNLIGDPKFSDKEIEEIRDGFLILAEIIYEQWLKNGAKNQHEKDNGKSIHNE